MGSCKPAAWLAQRLSLDEPAEPVLATSVLNNIPRPWTFVFIHFDAESFVFLTEFVGDSFSKLRKVLKFSKII